MAVIWGHGFIKFWKRSRKEVVVEIINARIQQSAGEINHTKWSLAKQKLRTMDFLGTKTIGLYIKNTQLLLKRQLQIQLKFPYKK